jgi:hypothetical protein
MPKLSLAKLERHLYSAADRLRQEGLDAATYKDYIFGMLFLKRCSDVWQAEHDALVGKKVQQGLSPEDAEAGYGQNPDFYDAFFVPERSRWTYLQSKLNDAAEPTEASSTRPWALSVSKTNRWSTFSTISASCGYKATSASFLTTRARISSDSLAGIPCATKTSSSQTYLGRRMSS